MKVPFRYHIRSLFYRKSTTILTLVAVGMTVAVLSIVLALQQGFELTLLTSARTDNIICMRDGATSEGESSMTRDLARKVAAIPEIEQKDGKPLAVAEMFAAINLDRVDRGSTNVSVRGTSDAALGIRDSVKVKEGAFFAPGKKELIVGRGLTERVKGCRVGGSISVGGEDWAVVGIIDSGGASFDSEIWGDVELLSAVFERSGYSVLHFRARPGIDVGAPAKMVKDRDGKETLVPATGLLGRLAGPDFKLKAMNERDYMEAQAGVLGGVLGGLARGLAIIMAIGAIFGCTNTLLSAVAGRTHEIGALLAIGFKPWQIRVGFLFEALVLGLVGGMLGILFALPVNGLATGTMNWKTFSEQAFAFRITGTVVLEAMILAAVVGVIGGLVPAWRASALKPTDAMRS